MLEGESLHENEGETFFEFLTQASASNEILNNVAEGVRLNKNEEEKEEEDFVHV